MMTSPNDVMPSTARSTNRWTRAAVKAGTGDGVTGDKLLAAAGQLHRYPASE